MHFHFDICPSSFPAIQWLTGPPEAVQERIRIASDRAEATEAIYATNPFFIAVAPAKHADYAEDPHYVLISDTGTTSAGEMELVEMIRLMLCGIQFHMQKTQQVLALCALPDPDWVLPRNWRGGGGNLPEYFLMNNNQDAHPVAIIRFLRHGNHIETPNKWFWGRGGNSGIVDSRDAARTSVMNLLPSVNPLPSVEE